MNGIKALIVGSMYFVLISGFTIGITNLSRFLVQ